MIDSGKWFGGTLFYHKAITAYKNQPALLSLQCSLVGHRLHSHFHSLTTTSTSFSRRSNKQFTLCCISEPWCHGYWYPQMGPEWQYPDSGRLFQSETQGAKENFRLSEILAYTSWDRSGWPAILSCTWFLGRKYLWWGVGQAGTAYVESKSGVSGRDRTYVDAETDQAGGKDSWNGPQI